MLAVDVCRAACVVAFQTCAVPVYTWFVPTAFVAVAGEIWIFASTQTLLAFPLPPAAVFTAVPRSEERRVGKDGRAEVAETTVEHVVDEGIVTVQIAVAAPPV